MSNVMGTFAKLSKALDSKNIGEVLLALHDLDDNLNVEKCEDTFFSFLHEIISWDLTKSPEVSELTVRHLVSLLTNEKELLDICERILRAQTAVAVQIAVEMMIGKNWKLSEEDCRQVWKKVEARKNSEHLNTNTIDEYASRITANCIILRVSGTPPRFLTALLLETLKPLSDFRSEIPTEFLNELAIVAPCHPLIVAADIKNNSCVFLIPRVISEEYRLRLEIDEFTKFLQPDSPYQRKNARPIFEVFQKICGRITIVDQMQGHDIERIVDFWLAALCIFDGYGIVMDDITEAAKLIEKTTSRFNIRRRPLFLKRFLRKLSDKKDSNIGLEPQVVATIITTFQRNAFGLKSTEFYEELGEFWTLCQKVKYDDIYYSTAYFSSVFTLAQAQALFRVKKELCREVYEKVLKPMHEQMLDFVELKKAESNKTEEIILEQDNLGSSYFSILICTYKNAEDRILQFINQ